MEFEITRLGHKETLPRELLLLADPSNEMIDKYIFESEVFIARHGADVAGVFVLVPHATDEMELRNIAVHPNFRRQGLGKEMIKQAVRVAKLEGFNFLIAKTADSSLGVQEFYKKMKFEHYLTVKAHFVKYYPEPIMEDGLQAIDQLAFKRKL